MLKYKVIVAGGGAAGLVAAGRAAKSGAQTLLIEKMNHPGRKLRITGKGRCNLTNIAPISEFITHFGPNGRFLRQAFSRFFSTELLAFFKELGIHCETERGGRVFPKSNQAADVVDALEHWISNYGVKTLTGLSAKRLIIEGGQVAGIQTIPTRLAKNKMTAKQTSTARFHEADAVIIATGGVSYPATGSTGDGYRLASSVGHTIVPIRPALVPLITAGNIAQKLQGLSLRNVTAVLWINGKKQREIFGEMLFTHFGLSGPIILSSSQQVVDALNANHKVEIAVDLKPALNEAKLDARLLRDLDTHGKRRFQTLLKDLLPRKLIPVCLDLTEISPDKKGHQITAQERKRLRLWPKNFRLEIKGFRSFNEAIITAGGVETREVNPRTMESRLVKGLYFAGEILDLDADTGGYNLQTAFSTGWVAGEAAATKIISKYRVLS